MFYDGLVKLFACSFKLNENYFSSCQVCHFSCDGRRNSNLYLYVFSIIIVLFLCVDTAVCQVLRGSVINWTDRKGGHVDCDGQKPPKNIYLYLYLDINWARVGNGCSLGSFDQSTFAFGWNCISQPETCAASFFEAGETLRLRSARSSPFSFSLLVLPLGRLQHYRRIIAWLRRVPSFSSRLFLVDEYLNLKFLGESQL